VTGHSTALGKPATFGSSRKYVLLNRQHRSVGPIQHRALASWRTSRNGCKKRAHDFRACESSRLKEACETSAHGNRSEEAKSFWTFSPLVFGRLKRSKSPILACVWIGMPENSGLRVLRLPRAERDRALRALPPSAIPVADYIKNTHAAVPD
jgi:hypothetical protein